MNPATATRTWAKEKSKNIESWVLGNPHAQIKQGGAKHNSFHRP